jgi:hypothetical protein
VATLPPDLDRLGQQLAGAAGSTLAARRRRAERRRRVTLAVIGAVAFAVLTPGPLGSGVRDLGHANLVGAGVEQIGCENSHGRSFILPDCDGPMILHRPYAWR